MTEKNNDSSITLDSFLGGLLKLKQYQNGYRATSDSVLLASAVKAKENESVLDVGTGNGVVLYSLARRVKHLKLTGVDIQQELVDLARQNALLNQIEATIEHLDIFEKNNFLKGKQFHHVVSNPPFYDEPKGRRSEQQRIAFQSQSTIEEWVRFCLKHIKPKGTLTLIHRPQALPQILSVLEKSSLGAIEIIPIFGTPFKEANRIIIRGVLNNKAPLVIRQGLLTHDENGNYTNQTENILRHAGAL